MALCSGGMASRLFFSSADMDSTEIAALRLSEGITRNARFRKGVGCSACRNTGYHGRVGCFELLVVDDAIRKLVQARATASEINAAVRRTGSHTLCEDGLTKVAAGVTTFEELLRVSSQEAL